MFIETLEFTIPMDLCDLFSTMKRGPGSNLEFPASVNSYGTTQDANIQVVVRSNKLTFKVDGVSSDASMISKSECKTLKLSVFDVDRSLMPSEEVTYESNMSSMQYSSQMSAPAKRLHEQSVSLPPAKSSRTSYNDSPRPRSPAHRPRSPAHRRSQPHVSPPRSSENSHSKSHSDTRVNVKQEPEDPDLIEIDPDDIVPKKETPYMQIDYSSDVPHTQTSQAALERLSHHQSSHSQSPASSSSSFHQNVPHVPDYSEPGPSQGPHGDQSADDFLVFQDENEDGDDNEADYSNDDNLNFGMSQGFIHSGRKKNLGCLPNSASLRKLINRISSPGSEFADHSSFRNLDQGELRDLDYPCPYCDKVFRKFNSRWYHIKAIHEKITFQCKCGKVYTSKPAYSRHSKQCYISVSRDDVQDEGNS